MCVLRGERGGGRGERAPLSPLGTHIYRPHLASWMLSGSPSGSVRFSPTRASGLVLNGCEKPSAAGRARSGWAAR
eukprot:scaffold62708_cov54-Phaeocystis_antarctica.AAC.1